MALKYFVIDSFILAAGKHCRLDPKYTSFTQVHDWIVFDTDYKQVRLADLLEELPATKQKKGELEEEALLVNISDQQQRSGELENVEVTNDIGSDKNYLGDADIFISKLGMPKGYIFVNTFKGQNLLGSSEFIPYRIRNNGLTKYLKYILLHPRALDAYACLESGKTPSHKRVNPYEFLKIKVPLIPQSVREKITLEIEQIEQKIEKIKDQIAPPDGVINRVFATELGFSEDLYNEFGKGMTAGTQVAQTKTLKTFHANFNELARSEILRFSTRFHNPPTKKLMSILGDIKTLQIKDVISEPVHRGASPRYDSEGEIPVVKTGHLKNGYIEISQEEFVTQEFYNSSTRSQVRKGDVLIASTGKVSLGKVDILEDDQPLVADGHVSILRIDESKYNRLFFTYFFRSILGYFQIERDFTGATNQIELYADEIMNFKIPDISLQRQQKIVDEIKAELDMQSSIKQQIEKERIKIDKIIEKAMSQ